MRRRFVTVIVVLLAALGPNVAWPGSASAAPAVPSRFVSRLGSPTDWSRIIPGAVTRWDPTLPRKGHPGNVITWHYDATGSRGRVSAVTIRSALRPIAAATGFRFQRVRQPARADVRIHWCRLQGCYVGVGGPATVRYRGDRDNTIVSGLIDLNFADGRRTQWRELIMHEMGHVMGLGHARGRTQIMYPVNTPITRLGRGDVAGLRAVSAYRGAVR